MTKSDEVKRIVDLVSSEEMVRVVTNECARVWLNGYDHADGEEKFDMRDCAERILGEIITEVKHDE